MTRVFISDCEGPISKNDNAFELTSHFVPDGGKLFTVISRYDDVLADVVKKAGYRAGDTLKLVLPFLKAYGVTDEKMRGFSREHLLLISNAKVSLKYVKSVAPVFIVSTSYEHYIRALCQALDFPYENTYCTKVNIDEYGMTKQEVQALKQIAREIARMPIIEIPYGANSLNDLSDDDQRVVRRLDEIFWKEISSSVCRRMFSEVNPVGGKEKAEAISDVTKRLGVTVTGVMYVGDSITDEKALRLVKENDGLAVSFNGNPYAIENAEIAILSETSLTTAVVADAFCRFGKQQTLRLVKNWNRETLKESQIDQSLLNQLFKVYPRELPKVKIVTSENMQTLAKESNDFRKKVRGEAIGRLG
jgi:energy-converting hydrogenase A subunit R